MSRKRKVNFKGATLRIAIVVKTENSGTMEHQAVFAFKGVASSVLHVVFNQLKNVMMTDYEVETVRMQEFINGRCPEYIEVRVKNPDFHLAGSREWCVLIEKLLKRCVPCEVVVCNNYERFLNL